MTEIGYQADSGLVGWGKLTAETHETNPELQWPNSIDVFDRMRREDPQVKSVLRAVTLPIMRTEWVIDGAGCRPEVVAHVAADLGLPVKGEPYVAPLRTRGRFSFKEFLRLALLELVYGHSFFEQVYDQSSGSTHLAKLAWRPPRTISDIEVAKDGGLVAIRQHGLSRPIGVDRLVAFVNEREGSNWLGESLLRSAYKMWLLKDRVLRIQALTAERNGLGLPVFTVGAPPEGEDLDKVIAWLDEEIKRGLEIAKQARAGEAAGAAVGPGGKLEFVGVSGKLPDTEGPIRYYDEQIARAVLAHFLNLGTETGSWALGSTFANFFTDSLNAVAQHIADVTQQHVIEDLVDHAFGPTEPAPRLVPAVIGEQQQITADAIKSLIECGAVKPDPALRAYVRDKFGLPVEDLTDAAETADAVRDLARTVAEISQKVYLATDKPPLRQDEARDILRAAGADLTGDGPDVSRIPSTQPEEAA
ncbi:MULTISPECIES: phage portal protein family protein [unclassified Microbacterium]|uniref:phage portal protein family protein n=1 Tax=unclassified Microbacterium TaxID=2609290 RepID=UPI0030104E6E